MYNRGRLQRLKKIMKFGKPYINSFPEREIKNLKMGIVRGGAESPVGIGISYPSGRFIAKLLMGFGKETFTIYAVKGEQNAEEMRAAVGTLGKPWGELLMEEALKHAKALGLKRAELLDPLHNPEIHWSWLDKKQKDALINFYSKLRDKFDFKEAKGSPYWTKSLAD
ncbi:MAG: hypothetical protein HYW05_04160 [Candidatus Diapherotrites archaeon]|nr:hypothetical protein [Candidatus Diapherotrites archaeon]